MTVLLLGKMLKIKGFSTLITFLSEPENFITLSLASINNLKILEPSFCFFSRRKNKHKNVLRIMRSINTFDRDTNQSQSALIQSIASLTKLT